jgi:hypothetical protein
VWFLEETPRMFILNELLDTAGIDRNGFTLNAAEGISLDGRAIVGHGTHSNGRREAFRLWIDDVSVFGPYLVIDGIARTGSWMGPLQVDLVPWVWSFNLGQWMHMPESTESEGAGWAFIPGPNP